MSNSLTIISNRYFNQETSQYEELEGFLDVLRRPDLWINIECEDILAPLQFFFEKMPENTKIYYQHVSQDRDVTPTNEDGIEKLRQLQGHFFIVAYPGEVTTIVAVILLVAVVAMAVLFRPKIPSIVSPQGNTMGSQNNELSKRTNEANPNGRIPDIVGMLRAVPNLICVPFTRYINHQEVEDVVLCLGRGAYTVYDARDGETSIYEIEGTSLQVYKPNARINSDSPYFHIGPNIPDPAVSVTRSNSVNGQELKASDSGGFTADNNVFFRYPNLIVLEGAGDFSGFGIGETIVISRAQEGGVIRRTSLIFPYDTASFLMPFESSAQVDLYASATSVSMASAFFLDSAGAVINLSGDYDVIGALKITIGTQDYCRVNLANPVGTNETWAIITPTTIPNGGHITHTLTVAGGLNFNGTYIVQSSGQFAISLENPSHVNANWAQLIYYENMQTDILSPIISRTGERWIGPFTLDDPARTHLCCNYSAQQGMYKQTTAGKVRSISVAVMLEVTELDENKAPVGPPYSYQIVLSGSNNDKDSKGATLYIETLTVGRISVRSRRITEDRQGRDDTYVDQVKWKDLFGIASLTTDRFGDCTMIRMRQWATTGALALKERKLNMLVCRNLPVRISGSNFTTELYPTRNVADILCWAAMDDRIGRLSKDEVDFDNIYSTTGEVIAYFGTPLAAEFAYTLDKIDLSFEETANMIANAAFCSAFRRGGVLKLFFEKQTDRSSLLFNHRNKVPGSETRSFQLGYQNDNDGIEFPYVSPIDDAQLTLYVPSNRSAINPKKYDVVGIRSRVQAWLHAYRLYNRLLYQFEASDFRGMAEAFLLLLGDRILVADNTTGDSQDGEVIKQNGLMLTLSHDAKFEDDKEYYIFLQLPDATVESIRVYPGAHMREVILAQAPRLPLVYGEGKYARTTYMLSDEVLSDVQSFLVTKVDYKDNLTVDLSCVNYDDRYYKNDLDFIRGVISEEKR